MKNVSWDPLSYFHLCILNFAELRSAVILCKKYFFTAIAAIKDLHSVAGQQSMRIATCPFLTLFGAAPDGLRLNS